LPAAEEPAPAGESVQAQVILTVSESKRLIGRAVAQMPAVKQALKEGMVIICKGTTTGYVAEEILGRKIERGAFVTGRTYPEKGGQRLEPESTLPEVILIKGQLQTNLPLAEAVKKLQAGDVVIKGANALYYEDKLAAGIIGAPHCSSGNRLRSPSRQAAGDVQQRRQQANAPHANQWD